MTETQEDREKRLRDELAQYYYGRNYDKLPKDKREHVDTQMIVHEEAK
jgi:hypothetical protein